MSIKYLSIPLLILTVSAGCTRDRLSSMDIAETPPYWQSQSQLAQNQLEEMRAFHENESAKMSEDILVFRNGKTERLAATGRELPPPQEKSEKMANRSTKWTSWFKKKNKEDAPLVSETNKNVR